jgi:hypothetical protein
LVPGHDFVLPLHERGVAVVTERKDHLLPRTFSVSTQIAV